MLHRIKKYPLDRKGDSPENRVYKEFHDISKQNAFGLKTIVLDNGYFYNDSLMVYDRYREEPLNEGIDYVVTGFSQEIIETIGKKASCIVVVKNQLLSDEILITAQMVGGKYCRVGDQILHQLKGLLNNTRKIRYSNIREIPDTFTLNKHIHPYWDLYKFEPRISYIERMSSIMQIKLVELLDDIKEAFDAEFEDSLVNKNETYRKFMDHIENLDNPHKTTTKMLDLDKVTNGVPASSADVTGIDETYRNIYLTPKALKEFLDNNHHDIFADHIANMDNPHRDTAKSVNTYTESEVNIKDALYYDRGTITDSTTRFNGKTFTTHYDELRANLNANEIKSGTVSAYNLGGSNPSSQSFLYYDRQAGNLGWQGTSLIPNLYGVIVNEFSSSQNRHPGYGLPADPLKSEWYVGVKYSTTEAINWHTLVNNPTYYSADSIGISWFYARTYRLEPYEWGNNPSDWRWYVNLRPWNVFAVPNDDSWRPYWSAPPPMGNGSDYTHVGPKSTGVAHENRYFSQIMHEIYTSHVNAGNWTGSKVDWWANAFAPGLPGVLVRDRYKILMWDGNAKTHWVIIQGKPGMDPVSGTVETHRVASAKEIDGIYGPISGPRKPTHNMVMYSDGAITVLRNTGYSWTTS